MPAALVLVILLVAVVVFFFWISNLLVHLTLTLFVAGLVGWLADRIVPGTLPYGWLGAIVAGLVGGLIGQLLIGSVGPQLFGVRPIPALVGAVILAVLGQLFGKSSWRKRL